MKRFFKQGITQIIGWVGVCTVMCGAMIGILISSGALLLLAEEGRNKIFLIPALILLASAIYLYFRNKKACRRKEFLTTGDKMCNMMLFMFLFILIAALFIVYIFVPLWIPGYEGGILLP
jgi:hypothetical protein